MVSFRLVVACAALALAACASLPSEHSTAPSTALTGTADTKLGVLAVRALANLKEPSGVHLLYQGPDAFLASCPHPAAAGAPPAAAAAGR